MALAWGYLLLAYLFGAIPTGYIIAKMLKGIDIREHGSGSVGATNVKRVVGNKAGTVTLILDCIKGYIPTVIAVWLFDHAPGITPHLIPALTGIVVLIGHSKSVYIGFKGGKAVISSVGVLLALEPIAGLLTFAIGVAVIKATRYVSLGSIIAALCLPLLVVLTHGPILHIAMATMMTALVVFLHRSNIQRLLTHQENRI